MRLVPLLLLFICITPLALASDLPDLGDASQAIISNGKLARIGNLMMAHYRAQPNFVRDPELTDYLDALGARLAAASPDPTLKLHFFVLEDRTINAFAMPGNYVAVQTGLITATQNESELAAVLAHEISHITQHHIARMVARESQMSWPSLAAMALAILAARSNSDVSGAAIAASTAGSLQAQLTYSRGHEAEADRIGIRTLTRAGFDPRAMVSFFQRLEAETRIDQSIAPAYLRDHPLTWQRIADMQNRVDLLPYRQVPSSLDYELLRAKVRVMAVPAEQAIEIFGDALAQGRYTSRPATLYGLSYALFRDGQYAKAADEAARLAQSSPANPIIDNLRAMIAEGLGNVQGALAIYRAAVPRFPAHRALRFGEIRADFKLQRIQDALEATHSALAAFPNDPQLYRLEAQCYARQGHLLLEHEALAKAYEHLHELSAAIEQLSIASRSGDGNFYQRSIVEAELRTLRRRAALEKSLNPPQPKRPRLDLQGTGANGRRWPMPARLTP